MVGNIKPGFQVEIGHPNLSTIELTKMVSDAAKTAPIDNFDEPLRWYIYDELHETDFQKSTPYGYYQGVWFYLGTYVDEKFQYSTVKALAENLKNKWFGNDRGW